MEGPGRGKIIGGEDARIIVAGKRRRVEDGEITQRPFTVPPAIDQKRKRRAKNKTAKLARKANRAR